MRLLKKIQKFEFLPILATIYEVDIFLSRVVRVLVKSKTRTNTNVSTFDKS
jgi:hypothetical protein